MLASAVRRGLKTPLLVGDLPFEFPMPAWGSPSPTECIDTLFDIQGGLLGCLTGGRTEADERLELAS